MKWALLATGILAVAFVELFMGGVGCGRVPVLVCGVVTDVAGAPIEGAVLLTLFGPEEARDPKELRERREIAGEYENCSREDLVRFASVFGSARTDASGAFEIIVGFGISHSYGALTGVRWFTERGSVFDVAGALLVEKEGHISLVFDTKDARWIERPEGRIAGTLDVGAIRLARR